MALPRVHSQTYSSPLWALAGLRQRSTHTVIDPNGATLQIDPVEHASVAQLALSFPADTVWAVCRPLFGFAVWVLLALDEHRRPFEPRPYYVDPTFDYAAHGQSIGQLWFAGAHRDVGGGYGNSAARLSNESLQWMLEE